MQGSGLFFILYLAYGRQFGAQADTKSFIGGRATCGAFSRTVTAASFVSSNCYRLTNANANLACSRYGNKPTVFNYGASSFIAACNDPPLISSGGPKFAIYSSDTYYVDLQVVSSDTSAALGGTNNYLAYDYDTGYIQVSNTPPYDVNQTYSFVLINKLTGATSDPVYFTAKLIGCNLILAGPSSVTVCTGPIAATAAERQAQKDAAVLVPGGTPVATYKVCNTGVNLVDYDPPGACPIVTASSNGDMTACYISTNSVGNPANYVYANGLGSNAQILAPQVKFTQTLLLTAVDATVLPPNPNYLPGTRSITVTFDPTCNQPTVTTAC